MDEYVPFALSEPFEYDAAPAETEAPDVPVFARPAARRSRTYDAFVPSNATRCSVRLRAVNTLDFRAAPASPFRRRSSPSQPARGAAAYEPFVKGDVPDGRAVRARGRAVPGVRPLPVDAFACWSLALDPYPSYGDFTPRRIGYASFVMEPAFSHARTRTCASTCSHCAFRAEPPAVVVRPVRPLLD